MRTAYAVLGLLFLTVAIGVFFVAERANAPTVDEPADERGVTAPSDYEPANTQNTQNTQTDMFTLTSPVFEEGGRIPSKYTCDGENINPELLISGVPNGAETLVLTMDDPDIPESVKQSRGIERFDHWVLYNIPADSNVIEEGNPVGTPGRSSTGEQGYVGPCPPDTEHRYIFRLYALPTSLTFVDTPTLREVEEAARETAIESTALMGRYERTGE